LISSTAFASTTIGKKTDKETLNMHLTQSVVNSLKPPEGASDFWIADDAIKGFGVRFRRGVGFYCVRYSIAGRDRRLSFSRTDRVSLNAARAWAKEQFGVIAKRIDPALERAKAEGKAKDTIGHRIPIFIEFMRKSGRAEGYVQASDRSLTKYFAALHPYAPEDVTRAMVANELTAIRAEHRDIAGDRARGHLSNFYGWLMKHGYEGQNPVTGTLKIGAPSRERVLSATEIRTIWHGVGGNDYGSIVRLLILLGLRKNEIGKLRWDEVNFEAERLEIPASRTKNRKAHLVPLPPAALKILRQQPIKGDFIFGRLNTGFSGWGSPKARLDAKINIAPWTVHDLRRTFSTIAHETLAIEPHIVERLLNHSRRGVAGVYDRGLYLEQRKAALIKYADYIASVVGGGQ
jgi:integrase